VYGDGGGTAGNLVNLLRISVKPIGLAGSLSGLCAALVCASALAGSVPTKAPPRRTPPRTATATPIPTPVPPRRVPDITRRGEAPPRRVSRFPNPHVGFSELSRVEEVDCDRDGVPEALVEGIGSVRSLPPTIPALGFISRRRLPFENPLLVLFRRGAAETWNPLWIAHVPLRCAQSDDPARCDQVAFFGSVRFRFDDRPQMVVQILHAGDSGANETYAYRLVRGRLETTFAVSAARSAVDVAIGVDGITRRLAIDTFVNRELPPRYRSFTLVSSFVFGERKFRVLTESVEEEWGDRRDFDLAYWGLVRGAGFAGDVTRWRERHRRAPSEAPWKLDPREVVRKRYPDATRVRFGAKQPGLATVYFERPSCHARAVLYQPVREWEGEKSLWEMAILRGAGPFPYECLEEEPLTPVRR
jgi:hypothetical protein